VLKVGGTEFKGRLQPGEFKWVQAEHPPTDEPRAALDVSLDGFETEDLAHRTQGLDNRVISVGLAGFFLCAADDAISRATFLEAVALGNLAELAFNREREAADAPSADVPAITPMRRQAARSLSA
jgi:hypothetical protein